MWFQVCSLSHFPRAATLITTATIRARFLTATTTVTVLRAVIITVITITSLTATGSIASAEPQPEGRDLSWGPCHLIWATKKQPQPSGRGGGESGR